MSQPLVRTARAEDARGAAMAGILPDRWRADANCRSFVAHAPEGRVVGHCRGIDNAYHPASRTLVLEVADDAGSFPWAQVADALLEAQIAVSTLPLRVKPASDDAEAVALCARHDGVLVQVMPPWRYTVGPRLRAWADAHRATRDGLRAQPASTATRGDMLSLFVEHYTAQHMAWSPASPADRLRELFAPDFAVGAEGALHLGRCTVLVRSGRLVAQAIVWPPQDDGAAEVTVQCTPPVGAAGRRDMEACLAAVMDGAGDGDVLLIDSHLTETVESAMLHDLPSDPDARGNQWTAVVDIPVPDGPEPIPFPARLLPDETAAFACLLGGDR